MEFSFRSETARRLAQIAATAALYYIAGRLALLLAIPPGYATAVWPAAGIALAAVLVCGYRVWPGILLGSFFVNVWTSVDTSNAATILKSLSLATGIGGGAALQAVVGGSLVRRFVGFPHPLDSERAVLKFLGLGGPVSCLVNATVSVTSLLLGGVIPKGNYLFSWWTWWVGDMIGVMIFAPLALIWIAEPRAVWRRRGVAVSAISEPTAIHFKFLTFISLSSVS